MSVRIRQCHFAFDRPQECPQSAADAKARFGRRRITTVDDVRNHGLDAMLPRRGRNYGLKVAGSSMIDGLVELLQPINVIVQTATGSAAALLLSRVMPAPPLSDVVEIHDLSRHAKPRRRAASQRPATQALPSSNSRTGSAPVRSAASAAFEAVRLALRPALRLELLLEHRGELQGEAAGSRRRRAHGKPGLMPV